MKKFIYTIGFLTILLPSLAHAAVLSATPTILDSTQRDAYTVMFVLDTQGQSINTIEGTVKIASGLETPADIIDANSVVNYWVQEPKAGREIKFSGGITGGFNGDKGFLFGIQFPPRDGGNVSPAITFSNVKAYLNDGLATPATVTTKTFSIRQGAVESDLDDDLLALQQAAQNDNIPPEVFSPQVSQDPNVFDGKWFITFNTQDKQSGIDHYQVQESLSGKIDPGKWKTASSPYLLQDQSLHSYIFVLASDKQGNERVIKVAPRNPIPIYKRYQVPIIVIIIIVALSLVYKYLKPNVKRKTK